MNLASLNYKTDGSSTDVTFPNHFIGTPFIMVFENGNAILPESISVTEAHITVRCSVLIPILIVVLGHLKPTVSVESGSTIHIGTCTQTELPAHEQRVVTELQELNTRLEALGKFIDTSPIFSKLVGIEQDLLVQQRICMENYARALVLRIAIFRERASIKSEGQPVSE